MARLHELIGLEAEFSTCTRQLGTSANTRPTGLYTTTTTTTIVLRGLLLLLLLLTATAVAWEMDIRPHGHPPISTRIV